jgi:hypothetical protein
MGEAQKTHGKVSARAYTGAEAAECEADQAEQSSKKAGKQPARESTPENSKDEDVQVPATPPRLRLEGESRGGTTIALAIRTSERLRSTLDLAPKVLPTAPEPDPARQLLASTVPPSLGYLVPLPSKRKRQSTVGYIEGREDGYTASVVLSQPK